MPDPPVIEQTEVETTEAATNPDAQANDTVMAEDNVEPEDNAATDTIVPPIISHDVVPPPRPHTMENTFN